MITKKATNQKTYLRNFSYNNSARDAWSVIIEQYKAENANGTILLPSYIGWSTQEGSGIFDSVLKSNLRYDFYTLDVKLKIDISDLQAKAEKYNGCLVLLVHYFGFIDTSYTYITNWLDETNIYYVEDCAHAWLSDLIGGVCGRRGKFSFYSLHKLLPLEKGGLVVNNNPCDLNCEINPLFSFSYDLHTIYKVRRENYIYLLNLLRDLKGIEIIYNNLDHGVCPQSLPVILNDFDRDELYFKMNESGFGMVSLYHTMIKQLNGYESEASSILSRRIINFPIHQDVTHSMLDKLVEKLKLIIYA